MDDGVGDIAGVERGIGDVVGIGFVRLSSASHETSYRFTIGPGIVPDNANARCLVDHTCGKPGCNHTGRLDHGNLDLAARFLAHCMREMINSRLCRTINGTTNHRMVAEDRRQVDNMAAPLCHHPVIGGDGAVDHPFEIDVDAAVPGLQRKFMIGQKGQRHDTGIVDQHIDRAKRLSRLVHCRTHLFGLSDVSGNGDRASALRTDCGCGCLGRHAIDIDAGHATAQRSRALSRQPTKSIARAGNQQRLIGDVICHYRLLDGGHARNRRSDRTR